MVWRIYGINGSWKKVFHEYTELFKEWAVLDIGVGAGRTTAYLKDKSKS